MNLELPNPETYPYSQYMQMIDFFGTRILWHKQTFTAPNGDIMVYWARDPLSGLKARGLIENK